MTTLALGRIFDGVVAPAAAEWTPRADVFENEAGLSLQFDLPGVRAEAFEVKVEKGTLFVKGERRLPAELDAYHRVERPYGTFTRAFALPEFVNHDSVEASLADGVLTIFLPRLEETKPKQIQVQVKAA